MTDPAQYHYADLSRELAVNADFAVEVPLVFDNLFIEYSDTISDLQKDIFSEISDMVDGLNVRLKAKVESTLPLGVNVTAVPLDINGNPIQNGVTVEEITLEPGSEDSPSVSDLVLEIDIEEGMINVLDGLVIKAECESQQDKQSELRSTQYIYVKDVVLQLPQGVALDLTDNK